MTLKELHLLRLSVTFLVMILIVLGGYVFVSSKDDIAVIHFFDIGQGDSSMIILPNGIQILIDGGSGNNILQKLSEVMPIYDTTIEYIILSHPHRDHIAGIVSAMEKYTVGLVIYNGIVRDDLTDFNRFLELISKKNISTYIINSPLRLDMSEHAYMEFLYPNSTLTDDAGDINATSLVHRFTFGDVRVLYTGDIPRDIEIHLVNDGQLVEADILKVAHHGSRESSGEEFIRAVEPTYSVISVGKNNTYGHPHRKALRTLEAYGGEVLRTDRERDITFTTDGVTIGRVE